MKKNKKFSELITRLSEIWMEWMKYDSICRNEQIPLKERKEAVDLCEALVDQRYVILGKLDEFFS